MPVVKQPETRLLAEYLLEHYPEGGYRQRVPLGPAVFPPGGGQSLETALRMSRPWRPEVDAVVQDQGALVLIEAKVFKLVDGIAKLPLYRSLVGTTPELGDMRSLPRVMRLVAPWTSANAQTMARASGVELVVYHPAWIEQLLEDQHNYWTRESRQQRADRQDLLRRLGMG